MVQVVECLLCKCKALSSNPHPTKKKKKVPGQLRSQVFYYTHVFLIQMESGKGVKVNKDKLQPSFILNETITSHLPLTLAKLYLDLNFKSCISACWQQTVWRWPLRMRTPKTPWFLLLFSNILMLHPTWTFLLCHISQMPHIVISITKIFWISKAKNTVTEIERGVKVGTLYMWSR
jgi:hypothetical protein